MTNHDNQPSIAEAARIANERIPEGIRAIGRLSRDFDHILIVEDTTHLDAETNTYTTGASRMGEYSAMDRLEMGDLSPSKMRLTRYSGSDLKYEIDYTRKTTREERKLDTNKSKYTRDSVSWRIRSDETVDEKDYTPEKLALIEKLLDEAYAAQDKEEARREYALTPELYRTHRSMTRIQRIRAIAAGAISDATNPYRYK